MSDGRINWENRLKETPVMEPGFTEELRMNVRRKVNANRRRQPRFIRMIAGVLTVVACLGIAIIWASSTSRLDAPNPDFSQSNDRDRMQLQVFPDSELKAGQSFGYIFSFELHRDKVEGKTLTIEAVHYDTGRRETVVKPYVMTPEVYERTNFERYTAFVTLPIEGDWRFEVLVDGVLYADAFVNVGSPSWEPSGTFTAEDAVMTGIEGKVGFIDPGFVAGHPNKYMWHFWGSEEELKGRFEVLAVKQGSKELIPVFEASSLGGELRGATRHLPSSMSLPEPGLWRLLPYVEGKLIETIVVEVMEE